MGHVFQDKKLLERALTHKSKVYEKSADGHPTADNEQLEFLGDSILGFVVSDCLLLRYPSSSEGVLSRLKSHLVCAARLFEVARDLKVGEFLLLGRGEEMSGVRENKAILSDAVEAIIAAIYLDAGLDAARAFIETHVIAGFQPREDDIDGAVADYKTALQEMALNLKLPLPRYVIVKEEGPDHSKIFTVEIRLGKEWVSQAQGISKKSAGQKAAQQILQHLSEWGR